MQTDRVSLGARGERQALEHLASIGYEIIECNYRCRYGEIDIVARDGGDLVFVEVKTRRSISFGYPSEAVDARKQHKLVLAARHYLTDKNLGEISGRFDVVEVYFIDGKPIELQVIKGAFSE